MLLKDLTCKWKKLSKPQNLSMHIHLHHLASPCRIWKGEYCGISVNLRADSCHLTENFAHGSFHNFLELNSGIILKFNILYLIGKNNF